MKGEVLPKVKYLCIDPSGTGTTGILFFATNTKSKALFSEYKRTVGLYKLIGGITALKYIFDFIRKIDSVAVNQVKPFKAKLFRGQEQIENLTYQNGRDALVVYHLWSGGSLESQKSLKKKIVKLRDKKRLGIRQKEQLQKLEGVLPIINPEVVLLGLKLAAVLSMKISPLILFDRKIYNYFDLPKGYQITQQETPFATAGHLPIIQKNEIQKIPIKSLQLEEDTAKSTYSKEEIKLDFNRAGNPLIELVTEPVFHQIETVLVFIKQLQNLLRYLGVSEAKMERGQLRVDLNYSLELGNNYSTPRYEIKNLNSLANIEKALKYEINKHQALFSQGQKPPTSQTLGFDEAQQITIAHREKTDYYYLSEVNIPPIKISPNEIKKIVQNKPLLP
ncbi:17322_t:CDS:2 [Cetraspora pellucida]|uniref:17322_t:CDS:1 n=1 Tax=Cetraspora pellucida TaxID=1433469 RepID=A0ACA9K684_9GLOM|nr:17322_t:CDS:2 [Cetraspora pellucida]